MREHVACDDREECYRIQTNRAGVAEEKRGREEGQTHPMAPWPPVPQLCHTVIDGVHQSPSLLRERSLESIADGVAASHDMSRVTCTTYPWGFRLEPNPGLFDEQERTNTFRTYVSHDDPDLA